MTQSGAHKNKIYSSTKSFIQPIALLIGLYPLERIQTVRQIQQTFNKLSLKQSSQIFTMCTHFGIRSWFRGLSPYLCRVAGLYTMMHFGDSMAEVLKKQSESNRMKIQKEEGETFVIKSKWDWISFEMLKIGSTCFAYGIFYPLEVISIRMAVQIQRGKIYKNMGDCLRKIRKNEGRSLKNLYRGFSLSTFHLILQLELITFLFKNLKSENSPPLPSFLVSNSGTTEFILACLLSETFLYPFDSIRKIIQINGAPGHDNVFQRYADVLQIYNRMYIYRGFGIRLINASIFYGGSLVLMKRQEFL